MNPSADADPLWVQGRNVFQRDMEPFIKWLDEAEEEDED